MVSSQPQADPNNADAHKLETYLDALKHVPDGLSAPAYVQKRILGALNVFAPRGDANAIQQKADQYLNDSSAATFAVECLRGIVIDTEHDRWVGRAGESARQAFDSLRTQVSTLSEVLQEGADGLNSWYGDLLDAQRRDTKGQDQLYAAKAIVATLPPGGRWSDSDVLPHLPGAVELALAGCGNRLDASNMAYTAENRAIDMLSDSVERLVAHDVRNYPSDNEFYRSVVDDSAVLDKITLGYSDPGLMTGAEMTAAASNLAGMKPDERSTIEYRLKVAPTSAEALKIWKALGDGATLAQLSNPEWIQKNMENRAVRRTPPSLQIPPPLREPITTTEPTISKNADDRALAPPNSATSGGPGRVTGPGDRGNSVDRPVDAPPITIDSATNSRDTVKQPVTP